MPNGQNEAFSRILIDKALEFSGWNLLDTTQVVFELHTGAGRADYLLKDKLGRVLCVLEAKRENVDPYDAKEQARVYAENLKAPFVLLSNGREQWFWNFERSDQRDAYRIERLPSRDDLERIRLKNMQPPRPLQSEVLRPDYLRYLKHDLTLRRYQIAAIDEIARLFDGEGRRKFLLEMATGTGKTLLCAAMIRRFLATRNAERVLFIVDRIELAKQTMEDFAVGEVCTINPKLTVSERPPADCDVTFVPMAAVDEFSGTIARPEVRQYRQVSKGYTPFCKNDVLFAKITPCMENGKAAIARGLVNSVGFGSTEFHVLRPTPVVLPEWIFAFIRQPAFRAEAQANFTGTAGQRRVPLEFMGRVPIPIPPLAEQERIVKLLEEADQLQKLRVQADSASDALIPALFQELFGDPATNPKGWSLRPAGELMATCDYGTSQKANDEGRGITVLRMGNVQKTGELDLSNLKAVELSDAELTKQTLEAGDVLFNRTNSRDLVGKTGMWDGRMKAVAASYFIRVRFNRNIELPQHFTTFMNLPFMKRRLAAMARGAVGQANINAKELTRIIHDGMVFLSDGCSGKPRFTA